MAEEIAVGWLVRGSDGRTIGTVDGVFADYLLVRTAALLPTDLYVPRTILAVQGEDRRVSVDATRAEAAERWHRPLKHAPHD